MAVLRLWSPPVPFLAVLAAPLVPDLALLGSEHTVNLLVCVPVDLAHLLPPLIGRERSIVAHGLGLRLGVVANLLDLFLLVRGEVESLVVEVAVA